MTDFCPRCATARLGAFRFCRGCAFDFDAMVQTVQSQLPVAVPVAASSPATAVVAARTGRRFSGRAILGTGLVVVVGLAAMGSFQKADPAAPTAAVATASQPAAATATPTASHALTALSAFGPTTETTEADVVRIVDGDTIVVAFGGHEYKVRYIGMDTPETKDPNTAVQWMGPQATVANATLLEGGTVFLEKDVSEVDHFDRLLRYVWITDGAAWTLVNLELVRQGVAAAKSYPPDVRYDAVYLGAEEIARQSGLGLWGVAPAPVSLLATPKPTPKATARPTPRPTPRATPRPTAKPAAAKCHPSYDPCLPIVGDLDCPDIRAMGLDPVTVIGPDEYRLDGDHDGLGCE
ncbi:MAG TPA: thermonuclease family protein [Candidatus Limnocylindrales bacterium]|nr:thermonuclease family protein [Candidatus Limnocylindrales bacterium]